MDSEFVKKPAGNGEKILMRVSAQSMAVNVLLSCFKLAAGVLGHSGAMLSDAVHSASDVFSTVVVMIGFHLSKKESDEDHQYGHERLECIAALLLAAVLGVTGLGIGFRGAMRMLCAGESARLPGISALTAAVVSIVVKEGMYWYTRAAAKKVHSCALMADAWHHRSDAFSSVGSLAGIAGARIGFPLCDPAAGVIISAFIVKAAYDIFRDASAKLTDKACDAKTAARIEAAAAAVPGVRSIDRLLTRQFGARIYVDLEIEVKGSLSLIQAHRIAQEVHDAVEGEIGSVKDCMVHVNPCE